MTELDVFDFDGTIYDGDSTFDFLRFAVRGKPSLLLSLARSVLKSALLLPAGKFSLTGFKDLIFSGLAGQISLPETGEAFWREEGTRSKIGAWFAQQKRDLPVVIASASPDFELEAAARLLSADALICTRCDPETGHILGKNCKSGEKIRRIGEQYGEFVIRAMYTDSAKADGPLLKIAQERYLVAHGKVTKIEGEGEWRT